MIDNYKKHLDTMNEKNKNYEGHKAKLRAQAIDLFGKDIFHDYFVPDNFNYGNLSQDYFMKPTRQLVALPFDQAQFDELINMEKTMINSPVLFNHKGHTIHGGYFYGIKDGKVVLFALSITTDSNKLMAEHPVLDKYKFTIRLDMLINGCEPLILLRFDSVGNHPNLIENGKILNSSLDVNVLNCPHIHKNDEMTQVLCDENLDYTTAYQVPDKIAGMRDANDPLYFKTCIDNFFKLAHVKAKINIASPKVRDYYYYDYNNSLFDWNNIFPTSNKDLLNGGMQL